jgi:hypothetical protein
MPHNKDLIPGLEAHSGGEAHTSGMIDFSN